LETVAALRRNAQLGGADHGAEHQLEHRLFAPGVGDDLEAPAFLDEQTLQRDRPVRALWLSERFACYAAAAA
jgi:hypothetical protein